MTSAVEDFEYVDTSKKVAVRDFHVDLKVQRPADPVWVKKLADRFDSNKVGVLTASQREDGRLFLLDGQHRVLAAKAVGRSATKVNCRVITGVRVGDETRPLTLQEEAAFFIALNDSRAVTPAAKFNARLTIQDPVALDIMKILKLFRWEEVGTSRRTGTFTVIGAAETLYRSGRKSPNSSPVDGRDALKDTLQVISAAWGVGAGTALKPIVAGLGFAFLHNYEQQRIQERAGSKPGILNPMRLAEAWGRDIPDPKVLIARAATFASVGERKSTAWAIAELATLADAGECRGRTPRPEWKP